ncbi:MAG: hypothetical protein HZA34_02255 [Candidatus Pacebacteria bacterium]|nr:hypothetical protein [Candidatus Paceibacterota bacterium]
MGQHRTREQKEKAAARRIQQPTVTYSLAGLTPIERRGVVSAKQQAEQKEFVNYFRHDMVKTLVVCLVIAGIIAGLWLKLR